MSKFFEELKRRNVIKATIAYLVVAWIVIQVAIAVLPTFGAADWVIQAIIIVLAIGLPIWIIISWIYDITPEGIQKTPEEAEKQIYKQLINKRLNAFIIASLSIAVVVLTLQITGVFSSNSNNNYAIAVLPFVNMSGDAEQEYFSDGISEDIINMLAQVPNLKVMGRTSSFAFKGKNMDLKVIGEQLKVSHILEGSVRRSDNKLRITAQLVNMADGSQLFSEEFDRELQDVFDIQDEISEDILKSIKIKLLGEKKEIILKNYTENVEAYQLFLNGRYHYNKFTPNDFLKAIEYYEQAIKLDNTYAIAYAEMAYCYFDGAFFNWLPRQEGINKAVEYSEKSVQLDDNCSECHISKGRLNTWYHWDFPVAFDSLEKGLMINPNSIEGNKQMGVWYNFKGEFEEANKYFEKTIELDPFSLINLFYIAGYHLCDGDYNKMIDIGNKLITMEPNFFGGYVNIGNGQIGLGHYEDAIEQFEFASQLFLDLITLTDLGIIYGRTGNKLKAEEVIERMKKLPDAMMYNPLNFALIYAEIGEIDLAIELFKKALEIRHGDVLYLKFYISNQNPELMNDSRFQELFELMAEQITYD
jgi:serine/threonine-protein kinase